MGDTEFQPEATEQRRGGHANAILIVEDDPMAAKSLRRALSEFSFAVVATDLAAARHALDEHRWVGFLVDFHLPDGKGIELLPDIRARFPAATVLVMTGDVFQGGQGAVLQHRALFATKPLPRSWRQLFRDAVDPLTCLRRRLQAIGLTRAECEIFALMACGMPGEDVAAQLHIAPGSVRGHTNRALARLGFNNIREVLALAEGYRTDNVLRD